MSPPKACRALKNRWFVDPCQCTMRPTKKVHRLVDESVENVAIGIVVELNFDRTISGALHGLGGDQFWKANEINILEPRRSLDDVKVLLPGDRVASVVKSGTRCPLDNGG